MAAQPSRVRVIDQSQVAPPPGSVSTTTVPLTFFDIPWLLCPPVQRIFFYELPYPTLHFTQTVLPHLKKSLSLTLRHFFPLAAKLSCPPPPHQLYIVYNEGDAVQITVSESDAVFNHFVGNHARHVKTLQSFFPKLPVARLSSNERQVVPTMAIQFTVFPNSGISIGASFNHVAADGRSIHHFMKSWAAINRSHGEDITSLSLPHCNRDIIRDTQGLSSIILLKETRNVGDLDPGGDVHPDNVLITFVINPAKIEQLKHWITSQSKHDQEQGQVQVQVQVHMSTFVVTCAFMWVNLMKLQDQIRGGSSDDDDTLCHCIFLADCRERFELSIPGTYFGNCLTFAHISVKRSQLMGEAGLAIAAEAIGRNISELGEGALRGAERFRKAIKDGRFVTVAGSPKFQVYETDFGWGRPKRSDVVHMAPYTCFSLDEGRDDDRSIDVGIVIEHHKLDLFSALLSNT